MVLIKVELLEGADRISIEGEAVTTKKQGKLSLSSLESFDIVGFTPPPIPPPLPFRFHFSLPKGCVVFVTERVEGEWRGDEKGMKLSEDIV